MAAVEEGRRGFTHPQGAPRGLLLHYVLRRIAMNPCHGYEILQEIEEKTEGAWRPGAGSIYPILDRLLENGYIKSDDEARSERRVYSITERGVASLKEDKTILQSTGQKWMAMRRLFIELLEPDQLTRFLRDGTRGQFDITQEIVRTKMKDIPQKDLEYLLKQYVLSLEQQLEWAKQTLGDLKRTAGASAGRK